MTNEEIMNEGRIEKGKASGGVRKGYYKTVENNTLRGGRGGKN